METCSPNDNAQFEAVLYFTMNLGGAVRNITRWIFLWDWNFSSNPTRLYGSNTGHYSQPNYLFDFSQRTKSN